MKADWRCYILASLLAVATVDAADAESELYPSKPVQIIADSSAGSTPDVALRFVADRLTQVWGQQVVVVNRPGAGGSVAARAAAEAAPDGYSLYQPVLSTFVALHPAAPNVPLHVPQDFLPIGFVAENPMFIAVSPIARHLDPAGADRARQEASRRNPLCHHRYRAPDPPDRGTVAARGRDQAAAGALYRRPVPRHQRCRDRACRHDHRRLFGHRGSGAIGFGQVDRGRIGASAWRNSPMSPPWRKRFRVSKPPAGPFWWRRSARPRRSSARSAKTCARSSSTRSWQKKLATLGSYTSPMSPAEATAFIHKQQQMWQPVLDEIARKQR